MKNQINLNGKPYTTKDNHGTWFYYVTESGIEPHTGNISGEMIGKETLSIDDVIITAGELVDALAEWLDGQPNGINIQEDELTCEFPDMPVLLGLGESQKEKIKELAFHAIHPKAEYNTDVIVNKDGEISTHTYFGHVDYRRDDIAVIYTVTEQMGLSWGDMWTEGLTQEQREFCEEKGYYTIYESNSENPDDWEEYKIELSDFDGEYWVGANGAEQEIDRRLQEGFDREIEIWNIKDETL